MINSARSAHGQACRDGANAAVERTVTQFKDHPALLLWYINDEQGPSAPLLERYRNVSRWDGSHAVLQVAANYQCWNASLCSSNLARYSPSTDVLGIDPYPWQNTALTHNLSLTTAHKGLPVGEDLVTNFRALASVFGRGAGAAHNRSNLCVTQIVDEAIYKGPESGLTEPPYAVKRAAAFAAVACGCQGSRKIVILS